MLQFIGVPFTEPLSFQDASHLIDHAIESGLYRDRLDEWNGQKLKLHPELYAKEIAERKANRVGFLHERLNDEEHGQYTKRVTKAQVEDVVIFLDQRYPNWDGEDHAAQVWEYALPAVHHLFPDRVRDGFVFRFGNEAIKGAPPPLRSSGCLSVIVALAVISYLLFVMLT